MSLPRSSNTPSPATLVALLPEVVSDVAEQMFFGWAEACDAAQSEALIRDSLASAGPDWVHVEVAFRGAIDGVLHVALPCDLARDLGSAMLGMSDGAALSGALLDDAAGELANIICGAVLTRGEQTTQFELLPPLISRRDPSAAALTTGVSFFTINDRPMIVRFAGREP